MADAMENYYPEESRIFTYADYLKMEGPERYQLIYGEMLLMASPSVIHQRVQAKLLARFFYWLEGKPCEAFAAPLDVRLFPRKDNSDINVVQPDILVVCDKEKLDKNAVLGGPDLVIEIVSPSNSIKELLAKYELYQKAGVREYWIVQPDEKKVQVNVFENGHTTTKFCEENETVAVSILPGLEIKLKEIWEQA